MPVRPRPEKDLIDPDRALRAALDALQGLVVEGGHFHARRRGQKCPPACRAARRALVLAGRLPFGALNGEERVPMLTALSTETRVAAERLLEEVRAGR